MLQPTDLPPSAFFFTKGFALNSANVNYRVGIDVGSYSIGMAAIAIDDDGKPTEILSAISLIYDSYN